ncbi:hypothetical protein [uncultured Roseobacter sp.]|uniref:hypothetical protein n=1 Tax=uncultured Roseobacter sp. TaxID=114847 RepID=UPI00261B82F1|nr:hypothetical protein [uncultured Roseobacter sp.]
MLTPDTSTASNLWSRFQGILQPELGYVLVTLLAFSAFTAQFLSLKELGVVWLCGATPFAVALCLIAPGPRSTSVITSVRIVACTIAVVMALYSAVATITYPAKVNADFDLALLLVFLSVPVSLVSAVVSFWRPAFVFVPSVLVLQQKAIASTMFGFEISFTDYIPVLEMGVFLGLALMLLGPGLVQRLGPLSRMLRNCDLEYAMVLAFMAAVSAHFSNYFYSGLQKVILEGGPFLWVLHNPTHILGANAYLSGFLPTGTNAELSAFALYSLEIFRPVLNATILVGQLGALVFVARRSMLIAATLFYDITHVAIFFASGIMFWKWVALNTALVAAMRHLPKMAERRTAVIMSCMIVLLAPEAFNIVRLGWYDTPALTRTEVIAVTKDGNEYEVPSNFFGSYSVTAAQHRLGRTATEHFPTVTLGTTQQEDIFHQAHSDCTFPETPSTPFQRDKAWITNLVQTTHTYAAQQASDDGLYRYDLFPHHIWSNPWMFKDFAKVDPNTIDFYIYRTISSCIALDRGMPLEDVRFVSEFKVPAVTLD